MPKYRIPQENPDHPGQWTIPDAHAVITYIAPEREYEVELSTPGWGITLHYAIKTLADAVNYILCENARRGELPVPFPDDHSLWKVRL